MQRTIHLQNRILAFDEEVNRVSTYHCLFFIFHVYLVETVSYVILQIRHNRCFGSFKHRLEFVFIILTYDRRHIDSHP